MENTSVHASKQLQKAFEQALETMIKYPKLTPIYPSCVISDFFLGWTLASCQAFGASLSWHRCFIYGLWKILSCQMFDPLDLPGMTLGGMSQYLVHQVTIN